MHSREISETTMPAFIRDARDMVDLWDSYVEVKAYARQLKRENEGLKSRLSMWSWSEPDEKPPV